MLSYICLFRFSRIYTNNRLCEIDKKKGTNRNNSSHEKYNFTH